MALGCWTTEGAAAELIILTVPQVNINAAIYGNEETAPVLPILPHLFKFFASFFCKKDIFLYFYI